MHLIASSLKTWQRGDFAPLPGFAGGEGKGEGGQNPSRNLRYFAKSLFPLTPDLSPTKPGERKSKNNPFKESCRAVAADVLSRSSHQCHLARGAVRGSGASFIRLILGHGGRTRAGSAPPCGECSRGRDPSSASRSTRPAGRPGGWQERAEKAFKRRDEAQARQALEQKVLADQRLTQLEKEHAKQKDETAKLHRALHDLEHKVAGPHSRCWPPAWPAPIRPAPSTRS